MNQDINYKLTARHFAGVVPKVSFMLWEKERFRKLINFTNITQLEQDRIFNEIEVSFLGLFILYLEYLSSVLEGIEKELIEKIIDNTVEEFLAIFKELQIEEKFIKEWRLLIDMRLKEYRIDYQLLLKEESNSKELKKNDHFRITWARVETITLDCLTHIRRGKLEQKDPLRKYLQDWVLNVDKIFADTIKKIIFSPQGFA
ncbi:hypothetical protein HYS91_04285 [Candidatus Daviesbacteria bacterium]|nr:hypothetical protein [Candidatus Daviesbacteria bacterium]